MDGGKGRVEQERSKECVEGLLELWRRVIRHYRMHIEVPNGF
jgi:hypothetical protein